MLSPSALTLVLLATTLIAATLAATVQPIPSSNNNKSTTTIAIRVKAALSSNERRSNRDAESTGSTHPAEPPVVSTTQSPRRENATKKTAVKSRVSTPRQTDEALIKAATEIQDKASNGQLLLLICKSQCYQQRGQTMAWLRDYLNETNITNPDHIIHYYYYFAPDNASEFPIQNLPWPTTFPAFVYIAAGRAFQYVGDPKDHDAFKVWLTDKHQSTSVELSENGNALDELLNNAALCDGRKWLVLLREQSLCPMEHWENIARSLSDVGNLSIAHIPLHKLMRLGNDWMPEAEAKVIIEQRLPTIDLKGPCAHLLLLQNNAYMRYSGYVTSDSPGHVRRFAVQSQNDRCDGDGWRWRTILEPLTDIEVEYFAEEGTIDRLKRKTSYVIIGATGGIAIILLAITIFWGLNSAAFTGSK